MSTVVLYCWCHSDSASVLLYFTLFPPETKEMYLYYIAWYSLLLLGAIKHSSNVLISDFTTKKVSMRTMN